ncbi:MAG: dephospho-CoA kinase [Rhodospirillaceae bacterium]|nr:dephospho-CoA kinase [Rhodospirillaceae bacterium]
MALSRASHRRTRASFPRIIGLTGSIAMGKSTAASMLRRLGLPVFDSDGAARALTAKNGAAMPAIAKRFPGTVRKGTLDRQALAKKVFSSPRQLAILEAILHPLVKARRAKFLSRMTRQRKKRVIFDIPLLFETGGERSCDAVIVISAPATIQRQRVLRRPGMTAGLLSSILSRQMPDSQKRRRADIVIPSGIGKAETLRRLKKALMVLG